MFSKNKFALAAFALLTASTAVVAQKDLPTESVNIIKDFDARLLESNKIRVSPNLPPLDTTTKYQDYVVPPKPLAVQYEAPKLRPIGMKAAGKEKLYNGYAKAGGGVPSSLYGEVGYYLGQSEKFDGKLWFRHHSMNAKSIENQKFFNNDFLLNGNVYVNKTTAVEGKIGYSYDRVHYYGYDRDSFSLESNAVRQDFKILDFGGRVFNGERTAADINYFVAPKFYLMNDYYSNKETGFDLSFGATKWFSEKHPLRMVIRTDFTNYKDTATQKLNNLYLQPSFTIHTDFLKLKIGGNFASNRDIFYVFPDAELTLRIWGDGIQLFAGANGDLRKNNYRTIAEYNPFVQIRGTTLRNTQHRNYFGGVKGNLGWLEYSGQAGYSEARDLALYQTLFQGDNITRFQVLYDTAKIFNLQGTIKFVVFNDLTVSGTLSQSVFDMSNEDAAWGLPGLEGNFSAIYKLLDGKASLKGECYVADRIRRLDDLGEEGKDGALLDFSFGGAYYFTDNIGAFVDINNLLNNKRERWFNYPMYGLNVLIGLTARF